MGERTKSIEGQNTDMPNSSAIPQNIEIRQLMHNIGNISWIQNTKYEAVLLEERPHISSIFSAHQKSNIKSLTSNV